MNKIMRNLVASGLLAGIIALLGPVTPTHAINFGAFFGVAGTDCQLYAGNNNGYIPLGGCLIGAPALVTGQTNNGVVGTFYIANGADHRLYFRTDNDGWQVLTPVNTNCQDNPAATSYYSQGDSTYHLVVACTGGDNQVWYARTQFPLTPQHLITSWTPTGGYSNYGPAVVVREICIFGLCSTQPVFFLIGGADHALWYYAPNPFPIPWQSLGGWCTGHPAAANFPGKPTTYVACQGGNRSLYYTTTQDFSTWTGYQSAGGQLIDGPAIASAQIGDLGYFPEFVVEGLNTAAYTNLLGLPPNWVSRGGSAKFGTGALAAPSIYP